MSRYQKGKTNLDFTEARDSEWQWHQLGHMQVCTSLQTDNHTSTPPLSFFTGRMPFLPPNQQRQSTEGHNTQYSEEEKHNERRCSGDETRTASSCLHRQCTLQDGWRSVQMNTLTLPVSAGRPVIIIIIIIITDKWPKQ